MRRPSERKDLIAFLAALCLFLSTLEYVIPKPLPFIRIGLANLPILFAVRLLPVKELLLLVLLKVLGQGLIHGTLFSYVFLFSLTGSYAGGLIMLSASRLFRARISLVGTSMSGALASNLAQIFLAVLLLFGRTGWLIAPPMLIVGLISSFLLGSFAERFWQRSEWIKSLKA
jgi:heptaprenyl diphosphate synthase